MLECCEIFAQKPCYIANQKTLTYACPCVHDPCVHDPVCMTYLCMAYAHLCMTLILLRIQHVLVQICRKV